MQSSVCGLLQEEKLHLCDVAASWCVECEYHLDCVSCADASGPDGLQGATFSVLLMVAWTSVIRGLVTFIIPR